VDKNKPQDEKIPFEKLSLLAQLNCKADAYADQYLKDHQNIKHSRAPLFPTAGCQLHLAHRTTMHNIKRELILAQHIPPMKEKLGSKHNWDEATFNSIDWDGNRRALHNLIKHKSTLVKNLNDILPIGKMVHQYDPTYRAHCPSCPAIIEDWDHFWTYLAANRDKWRKECLSNMLKTINDLDMATPIQALLLDVLNALIYGKPLDMIPIDSTLIDVMETQAAVGWHHILKGRFVKQWSLAHDKYLGRRGNKEQNGGTMAQSVEDSQRGYAQTR
jgi:hypothetical protein